MRNIIFIGGIHGVGKGTLCKEITNHIPLIHLSSSKLLKWENISSLKNKRVANISDTQQRLIAALEFSVEEDKSYILDGHFCLLDSSNNPAPIPNSVYEEINPKGIIIVIENEQIIQKRLRRRDNISYDLELLKKFQTMEIERGREISQNLNINMIISSGNVDKAIEFINNQL